MKVTPLASWSRDVRRCGSGWRFLRSGSSILLTYLPVGGTLLLSATACLIASICLSITTK